MAASSTNCDGGVAQRSVSADTGRSGTQFATTKPTLANPSTADAAAMVFVRVFMGASTAVEQILNLVRIDG